MPTPYTDVLEAQCYHGAAAVCRLSQPWNLGRVAVYTYLENSLVSHQSSQSPSSHRSILDKSVNRPFVFAKHLWQCMQTPALNAQSWPAIRPALAARLLIPRRFYPQRSESSQQRSSHGRC